MSWFLEALKKYAVFGGRSRRREYWYFTLFNTIITLALALADGAVGTFNSSASLGLLGGIYSLAVLIPSLAVLVRRLHDVNRTGWWFFISFVPLIGALVLLVFAATDSTPEDNRYGPNPKAAAVR